MGTTRGDDPVTGPAGPETWYVLRNGTVLMESADEESGRPVFFQLQSARQITPEDLRQHDRTVREHVDRFGARWSLVITVGSKLLLLALAAVVVGFVLFQIDATEVAGGLMFWVAVPLAVLLYVVVKVGGTRLTGGLEKAQRDAGLVPGMVDEIVHARGLELIETHGLEFELNRQTSNRGA